MRIGIVSEYYRPWPGGISEHVHHEALELRRLGHEVRIITGGEAWPVRSVRVAQPAHETDVLRLGRAVCFDSNGARSRLTLGPFLWQLRARLAALQLDVLHVHAPLDPCLPLMASVCAPCPVVGTFHASFEPGRMFDLIYGQNPLAKRAFERLHTRIAVSQEARRAAQQYFPGEYRLLPNGVDVARFAPGPARAAVHPRQPLRVLFVGRPDARKGLALLVEAHAQLLARGLDTELVLCGVESAQAQRWLHALPARVRERVHALGYVTPAELAAQYARADVFCSPATGAESQGIVLLEAMASALPCVCFDIAGYREVVSHGATGLCVPERSSTALAAALESVLCDPALRARLGGAGRRAASEYAWPKLAGSLEALLMAAAAQPATQPLTCVQEAAC